MKIKNIFYTIAIMVSISLLQSGCAGKSGLKNHTNAENGHHHHGPNSPKQMRDMHPGK